jgi:hypothetical protein
MLDTSAIEWCLLGTGLCLKSEVWAAWWQGIGTVIAVGVAVAIPILQRRADRKHARLRALESAKILAVQLYSYLVKGAEACIKRDAEGVRITSYLLADIAERADSIDLSMLTGHALPALMNLRGTSKVAAAEAAALTHRVFRNWTGAARIFEELRAGPWTRSACWESSFP